MLIFQGVHGISPDGMFSLKLEKIDDLLTEARPGIVNLVFLQGVGPFDEGAGEWGPWVFMRWHWSKWMIWMAHIPKKSI